MDAIPYVDTLVREYLLFRGFTQSLRAFDAERGTDRTSGFQADKVVELIFNVHIPKYEYDKLVALLDFLDSRFFSQLGGDQDEAAKRLTTAVLQRYVVHALQTARKDKVTEFFDKLGERLLARDAATWEAWFALPYIKRPAQEPRFQGYFQKGWTDGVQMSLANFLSQVFGRLPPPAVLLFNEARRERLALAAEVEALRAQVAGLEGRVARQDAQLRRSATPSADPFGGGGGAAGTGGGGGSGDTRGTVGGGGNGAFGNSGDPGAGEPSRGTVGGGGESTFGGALAGSACPGPGEGLLVEQEPPAEPAGELLEGAASAAGGGGGGEGGGEGEGEGGGGGGEDAAPPAPSDGLPPYALSAAGGGDRAGGGGGGGKAPAAVGADGMRVARGRELYEGHGAAISRCRFSPDGANIASASTDGTVRIWAPSGPDHRAAWGGQARNATIKCSGEVLSLAWDPRGNKLLLLGTGGGATKRVVCDVSPSAGGRVVDIACSPAEPLFLSSAACPGPAGEVGRLDVWSMRTFKQVHALPTGAGFGPPPVAHSLAFNHNGKMVAAACADGWVRVIDLASRKAIMEWHAHPTGEARHVRFAPDQNSVFSLGTDGRLIEWSLRSEGLADVVDAAALCGGAEACKEFALDPQGRYGVFSSAGAEALIADLHTGGQVARLGGHAAGVSSVDWHPLLGVCVTGSQDHTVALSVL